MQERVPNNTPTSVDVILFNGLKKVPGELNPVDARHWVLLNFANDGIDPLLSLAKPSTQPATAAEQQIIKVMELAKNQVGSIPSSIAEAINIVAQDRTVSLDAMVANGGNTNLLETLPDTSVSTESATEQQSLRENLQKIIEGSLNPREWKVMQMRLGWNYDSAMSLDAIGKEYGVSRERIRQIEAKAPRKLRHNPDIRAIYGL